MQEGVAAALSQERAAALFLTQLGDSQFDFLSVLAALVATPVYRIGAAMQSFTPNRGRVFQGPHGYNWKSSLAKSHANLGK